MRLRSSSNSCGEVQVSVGTGPVSRSGFSFIQRRLAITVFIVNLLESTVMRSTAVSFQLRDILPVTDLIIFESG